MKWWVKKEPRSSADSWATSDAELEVRMASPSEPGRAGTSKSRSAGLAPFTWVSAPEWQASSTSTVTPAESEAMRSRSSA